MIFRKYYTIQSKKNPEELKKYLLGQHLKVHSLDFEIYDKGDSIKVIPHAENDDHVYTLPITKLKINKSANGSIIKMMSKPRRIDIGGPYLLIIFIFFAVLAGVLLRIYGQGEYNITSYILVGISAVAFIILWMRMEQGYFDYIRKINRWIKEHA
ncbi:MAG: hypothetical protein JNJ58_01080 [Chitinophagaceae bacterium]|nr:hypothetical protein [Chitinophagaceae bacterium]